MKKILNRSSATRGVCAVLLLPLSLLATETRTWTQSDYSDFEKGVIRRLAIRSDGLLTLAPRSKELFDSASPYLWSFAQDSKGNLYTGGAGAKLYRVPPDGKGKVIAELDALEIHAIAVDSKDRVYAATSPDGKIYRLTANGKPEVFYDPRQKYIWAMAFDSKGDLYIATGDQGEIHRVPPDGKGTVFFRTDETHVRSLAIDSKDNVIAGTEPGGLVLRVSPAGEGFVLYQMPKKEVTAVAVAHDGSIYAAAVGNRQLGIAGSSASSQPVPAPATASVNPPGGAAPAGGPRPAVPPPALPPPTPITGGSEVFQISPSGEPRRLWTHSSDVVYGIAFDAGGRAILGAGNRGQLYRIESPSMNTLLLNLPAAQVSGLESGKDGRIYAITANGGKVFEVGPGVESDGTIESDVFDSGMYSQWGRLSFEAKLNSGSVSITTRSGNLDQPQKNWSPWSTAITTTKGARIASPAARFVQWKATLNGDGSAKSPELESVDVAYLPKNVEPRIDEIELTPPNYKFPAPTSTSTSSPSSLAPTLSLPALGRRPSPPLPDLTTSTPTMQLAKGYVGARWLASDPNGDSMVYRVEIRGVNETEWKLLKDKVPEKYISWDSTAFPDGEYRLRITASDSPSNPPAEALTAQKESPIFVIDNTPPKITNLTAGRTAGKVQVRWHAADTLNNIAKAEYSVDGGDWTVASPTSKLSDSPELDYDLTIDAPSGEHTIAVRVSDDYDNQCTEKVVIH
jgi:sugar lactone lactonase YvrE